MLQNLDRRAFLARAAALGGSALLAPSLRGLAACSDRTGPLPRAVGYGPLVRSAHVPELWIPQGFTARKLSTTRAPSQVNPGLTVAYGLDGMAAFPAGAGMLRLVRNHEIRDPAASARLLGPGVHAYDRRAGGGTTTLQVRQSADGSVELLSEFVSLSGTHTNCAGGPTPWGSWITCEETTVGPTAGYEMPHGYCFEVSAGADAEVPPVPLKAMGRFVHEALAVDPRSGIAYLTEDQSYDPAVPAGRAAGFYRFVPNIRGTLSAGGALQMLKVAGRPGYVGVTGQTVGAGLPVEWVDVPDPDPADAEANSSAVFQQGWARGGAAFARLEGCWYGEGNVYFNSTNGGAARAGQVWSYRPDGAPGGTLTLLFESPSHEVLDSPDNLCVSPRGGLVLCEDGGGIQFLRGLTRDGLIFDFARTDGESAETAGACFSPDGRTLFFNIQGGTGANDVVAGGTYAIWGPWENDSL
ncbi:MAG TPA: alkaline phosphatase PhoX [Longimicrobium sp.]|nr:alkaline phosphatase PhoX [Longimicrobium sp.]